MNRETDPPARPTPDADLDAVLDAVVARSAHQRRTHQRWMAAGAAGIVVVLLVVVIAAGATRDDVQVDTASPTSSTAARTVAGTAGTTTTTDETTPSTSTSTTQGGTTLPEPTTTVAVTPTTTSPPDTIEPPTTETTTPPTTEPPVDTDLLTAMERWATHRPQRYQMTVTRSCFCGDVHPITVTVDGTTITSPEGVTGLTVDDLYAEAAGVQPQGRVTALTVDPTFGYPLALNIDHLIQAIDDEMYYTITDFQPL